MVIVLPSPAVAAKELRVTVVEPWRYLRRAGGHGVRRRQVDRVGAFPGRDDATRRLDSGRWLQVTGTSMPCCSADSSSALRCGCWLRRDRYRPFGLSLGTGLSRASGIAACRAGVPSVVVPFAGDQFFWADRLRRLRRLRVAPAYRRQGVATALSRTAIG